MRVYDIVMIVEPGHVGSYRPGRWFVDHRDDRGEAERFAEQCNAARFVNTLRYEVEAHDELDPGRAPLHKSWQETEAGEVNPTWRQYIEEDPNLYMGGSRESMPWYQTQATLEEVYEHPRDCGCPRCNGAPPDEEEGAAEINSLTDPAEGWIADAYHYQFDNEPDLYGGTYSEA